MKSSCSLSLKWVLLTLKNVTKTIGAQFEFEITSHTASQVPETSQFSDTDVHTRILYIHTQLYT